MTIKVNNISQLRNYGNFWFLWMVAFVYSKAYAIRYSKSSSFSDVNYSYLYYGSLITISGLLFIGIYYLGYC